MRQLIVYKVDGKPKFAIALLITIPKIIVLFSSRE